MTTTEEFEVLIKRRAEVEQAIRSAVDIEGAKKRMKALEFTCDKYACASIWGLVKLLTRVNQAAFSVSKRENVVEVKTAEYGRGKKIVYALNVFGFARAPWSIAKQMQNIDEYVGLAKNEQEIIAKLKVMKKAGVIPRFKKFCTAIRKVAALKECSSDVHVVIDPMMVWDEDKGKFKGYGKLLVSADYQDMTASVCTNWNGYTSVDVLPTDDDGAYEMSVALAVNNMDIDAVKKVVEKELGKRMKAHLEVKAYIEGEFAKELFVGAL